MTIDRRFLAAAAVAVLGAGVSGCATDPKTGEFVQYEFGEASKQTLMAQVIDPDPQYDTLVPETSGDHAQQAIDRYRNDKVKEPKTQRVNSANGSGSGGGSSSGGGSN